MKKQKVTQPTHNEIIDAIMQVGVNVAQVKPTIDKHVAESKAEGKDPDNDMGDMMEALTKSISEMTGQPIPDHATAYAQSLKGRRI